jgi:Uma2 family endonuclease
MSARATLAGRTGSETWPTLRDREGYEYVRGRWVKIPMGAESNWNAFQALMRLSKHCEEHGGVVLPAECALQIWPLEPTHYRKPDGSYFAPGRLPGDRIPVGMVNVPPDLVIEAVSPGDKTSEMDEKVQEYFAAGVRTVWLLFPRTRTVLVIHADGRALRLTEHATLTGEDVIPGFAMPVADLFQR